MEPLLIRNIIILSVTFIFGVYFSYTDISRRKIPNIPLLGMLVFGLFVNFLTIKENPQAAKEIPLFFGIAFGMGIGAYFFELWHAGDGKLFIASTINLLPFTINLLHSVYVITLNILIPLSICYCLMFPYLLLEVYFQRQFFKEAIKNTLVKTAERTLSITRILQLIMISAVALLMPINVNIMLRTIVIFMLSHLLFNPFRGKIGDYIKQRGKSSHVYGIISFILLLIIKITGSHFSFSGLLFLFGFVCFFNFYKTLEFFSHIFPVKAADLKADMELGLNLYKGKDKVMIGFKTPKGAEILFKESARLTESNISRLQEIAGTQPEFYVPIRVEEKPLPFAPFIVASTLFIMLKLMLII
ncbi:MAG: prepilin peptidase [Planctomycetes bacterium]|nr:prepilin peptidase [Planctomycetota bacterium]